MSVLTSWLASPPPDAAVEIAPGRVSAVVVGVRGRDAVVHGYATEPLPPGAVQASLANRNIQDPEAVSSAVRSVLSRVGRRVARVALVIPDAAAKVSLQHFDHVPAKQDDLAQLVRWQVRKSAPFPVEEAAVSFTPCGTGASGGREFLVVLAKRAVVEEYERACSDAGVLAGLVDLTSLSVLNLLLASTSVPAGDWLAAYVRPGSTSIAIARGRDLIFFRIRPEDDEEALTDVIHQTAMYYQDRLAGQGFTRVYLGGEGRTTEAVQLARRSLEDRLGCRVDTIDATGVASVSNRIGVSSELLDVLAPLTGILLRAEREPVEV
jgi:Tfp pilus assembly PilM family ATPase